MSEPRRYSETELRAIFEGAAHRQENARRAEEAARGGLTLEELQQIGAASGIDPDHVATAAADLATREERVETLLGLPLELRASRTLSGVVTDEAWERMVAELRRQFEGTSTVGQAGRLREWSMSTPMRGRAGLRVTLEPTGGDTRVRIEKSIRPRVAGLTAVAASWLGMALLAAVILTLTGNLDAAGMSVMFGTIGSVLLAGTQVGVRNYVKHQRPRLEALLDRLELIARDAAPASLAPAEAVSSATVPRLALDEGAYEDEKDETARNRGRARS